MGLWCKTSLFCSTSLKGAAEGGGRAADKPCHSPVACLERRPPRKALLGFSYPDTAPARVQRLWTQLRVLYGLFPQDLKRRWVTETRQLQFHHRAVLSWVALLLTKCLGA